ncbi:MAG: gamma-glutamyl-gamma-aminobutyrate hydrolase family protein [Rhodovibrio sp.]|nr:gamma-glutamyl-gamma-aminobutyrate hydrolase family protein [Rhodovibrio sp.]
MTDPIPLVALPACRWEKEGQSYHTIGDKYVRAVAEAAGCLPMMLPSLGDAIDLDDLVGKLDGLVLTGSPSNVHPQRYGDAPSEKAEPYDPARDALTLPLIRKAAEAGLPLLAICRGLQELNVAFGGTLYPKVHEVDGRDDHRRPQADDLDVQYGPRHTVELAPDGALRRVLGAERVEVNSLHHQAVREIAPALKLEGWAPDGTVEALSWPGASGFLLAVQWHPEYKATENAVSGKLFQAFAEAARARARVRQNVAGVRAVS